MELHFRISHICFLFSLLTFTLKAQIITTIAGTGTPFYFGDGGPATSSEIAQPSKVFLGLSSNLYIADFGNNRIREINSSGIINTVAGNGQFSYVSDGVLATSAPLNPKGITIDKLGNLYIADFGNSRIRKVGLSGMITTIAGNGIQGYSGDGAPATASELHSPSSLLIDTSSGNIYISDTYNHVIRMVSNSGIITTVAGNGTQGYSGDNGLATLSQLSYPSGMALDALGNLYIAEGNNVRKVNPSGIISTIGGNGTSGFSGDGGLATSAQLNNTSDVITDALGNIYIADYGNNRIRVINSSNIINTIAGSSTSGGFGGDGGLATSALLNGPAGLALDTNGNIYFSDFNNNRIRKFSTPTGVNELQTKIQLSIYPNPASDYLVIETRMKLEGIQCFNLLNNLGQTVLKEKIYSVKQNININLIPKGLYLFTITQNQVTLKKGKLIIE